MVEVFKTDVRKKQNARKLESIIKNYFPNHRINFDLEDCDKIFRIEGNHISTSKVIEIFEQEGFLCEALQ